MKQEAKERERIAAATAALLANIEAKQQAMDDKIGMLVEQLRKTTH